MNTSEQWQSAMETPGGKLTWWLAKVIITILVTTLIAIQTDTVKSIADASKENNRANVMQEQDILLLKQRMAALNKVSDATVQSLQAITKQVTINTDDIRNSRHGG